MPSSAAVKAFEHKKKALEKLVDLSITGYYSSPKQNNQAENKWNEERKNSLRKRLNQEEE